MAIFRLSDDLLQNKTVALENTFILEYMPFAPENYTIIYIFGRHAAGSDDTDFNSIALALGMDKSNVIEAFEYWQKKGLVNFTPEPPSIEFLPVKPLSHQTNIYDPAKYKAFNDQLRAYIKGRDINPNEYNQYYDFMESYNFEDNALLMIIGYCVWLKGADIRYQYILTVAKSFAKENKKTYESVSEKITEMELMETDLCTVLKTLSLKRAADIHDRNLFLKWKKEFGFKTETIIKVAKEIKRGGIKTLDFVLANYYEQRLLTFEQIEKYENERKRLYNLAKCVVKILGQKYDQLDYVIETVFSGWVAMGYEDETLVEIAKLCTKTDARSLEHMNKKVSELFGQGIISGESFADYLVDFNKTDIKINKLLKIIGSDVLVSNAERGTYKHWVNNLKMSDELITLGAELSKGKFNKNNPLSYINGILYSWYNSGVKTVDEAKAAGAKPAAEVAATAHPFTNPDNFVKRAATAEELNEMFKKYDDDEL